MKLLALLPLFLLTACAAGAQDEPAPPVTGTCMTHAVRSQAGSFTEHSYNGGVTWLPGDCI